MSDAKPGPDDKSTTPSIPQELVEHILLGPVGDRRQIQDSPILADVWIAYAKRPDEPQELLITPDNLTSAERVACALDELVVRYRESYDREHPARPRGYANVAYLQGVIVATLYFDEVLKFVLPATDWWFRPREINTIERYLDKNFHETGELPSALIEAMLREWLKPQPGQTVAREGPRAELPVTQSEPPARTPVATGLRKLSSIDKYITLASMINWARKEPLFVSNAGELIHQFIENKDSIIRDTLSDLRSGQVMCANALAKITPNVARRADDRRKHPSVLFYQVSLDRETAQALTKSIASVKADAARGLFSVDCSEIAWAVVDSGVNGLHECFLDRKGLSRVEKSYDFSRYRDIVSLDNFRMFAPRGDPLNDVARKRLGSLIGEEPHRRMSSQKAGRLLHKLASDLRKKAAVDWLAVSEFVEVKRPKTPEDEDSYRPVNDHGTHVAGIIGASKRRPIAVAADAGRRKKKPAPETRPDPDEADGMCPDIRLYDFRVIADNARNTEFSVIAALQFIRHLNVHREFKTIHGVNLSLSIEHDVRNYACGRTPVCVECELLVDSGVVVVAAAGNFGYRRESEGFGSYVDQTITDPGNADLVITVGSTHRYWPHTFGVSFFSSRGPTGDGRPKPDLVAPGERIRAPFREGWGDLDGTSMAAPHVSGAAAMLMARYPELIGQPRRIKKILCESATDLGRERSFQGHGMLDVLRAFQSI